ncbi:pyridoxal phosphate-dependent aminotransferase [Thioalkalivibrio sp. HK1]|uniref:pyridoxal phosphate-dependent aminotransferase n=1 Tax=Thioalkalivibrio sp. HK1 TaxID=1469245 RepID=UPI0004AE4541|nr:pyridoxal phosphate-dependent aminotransferase [Thioalkalivibrio sp. HK1]
MNLGLRYTSLVSSLPATTPFVGPEALERERGDAFRLRLGANESAFGISPKAAQAMRASVEHIAWYGDPEGYDLRRALAKRHGVRLEEVLIGAGIDEMLGNVVRMLVEPGTPVVSSLGAYPTFNYHVAGFGGALEAVPYRNDRIDLEALLDRVRKRQAPLVYLANPDNPMGTWHRADDLHNFIADLPDGTLLVLDEAYIEFAPATAFLPIDVGDPRVIRMRTFSKAHGMAGARIGYAIADAETIAAIGKIRNHFGINRIAQVGALASLMDEEFVADVVREVGLGRDEYHALAHRLSLDSLPSAANFVAIDVGDGDRARALLARLAKHGVFVRMPGVAPLDRCIRITVGTAPMRALFAEILEEVL